MLQMSLYRNLSKSLIFSIEIYGLTQDYELNVGLGQFQNIMKIGQ
jgi:hypothetical protein